MAAVHMLNSDHVCHIIIAADTFSLHAPSPAVNTPSLPSSLTCLSSAPDTSSGSEGWKCTQLTPLSCPSSTYLTIASELPKRSAPIEGRPGKGRSSL